tara:strand:+ start:1043 stop:2101 length:1059 start_codon:yes stop_codon:yes gene_type:complete
MAVSGALGTTSIEIVDLIDHALRKIGNPTPVITDEMMQAARRNLFFITRSIGNKGIPLWCRNPVLFPSVVGQSRYTLPAGTVQVMNASRRTLSRLDSTSASVDASEGTAANAFDDDYATICTQTTALGNISATLTTATQISTVGYLPGESAAITLVWESSDDGATWTTLLTVELQGVDNQWWVADLPDAVTAAYWRVRATSGTIVAREILFGYAPSDIPMGRLNWDDYNNMPNKAQPGDSLQFALDRQRDAPQFVTWPVSQTKDNLFLVYVQRQIMDVTALSGTLDVPQYWYEPIVYQLAERMIDELPGQIDMARLQHVRERGAILTTDAWNAEVDSSPIRLIPPIRRYTRA